MAAPGPQAKARKWEAVEGPRSPARERALGRALPASISCTLLPCHLHPSQPGTDSSHHEGCLLRPPPPRRWGCNLRSLPAPTVHATQKPGLLARVHASPSQAARTIYNPENILLLFFNLPETASHSPKYTRWGSRGPRPGWGQVFLPCLVSRWRRGRSVPASGQSQHLFPLENANCHQSGQHLPTFTCKHAHTHTKYI